MRTRRRVSFFDRRNYSPGIRPQLIHRHARRVPSIELVLYYLLAGVTTIGALHAYVIGDPVRFSFYTAFAFLGLWLVRIHRTGRSG